MLIRSLVLISCFSIIYHYYGFGSKLLFYMGVTALLLEIAIEDYKDRVIDDRYTAAGYIWATIFMIYWGNYSFALRGIAAAAIVAAVIYVSSRLLKIILKKDASGAGDYPLILLLGFIYGAWGFMVIIYCSLLAGILAAFLTKRLSPVKDELIPFAPVLAAGVAIYTALPHSFWINAIKMVRGG